MLDQQLDIDGNLHDLAPEHETMHLFDSAPQIRGQIALETDVPTAPEPEPEAEAAPLPPSANGYVLEVNGHTLTASWPASFYVLSIGWPEDREDEPLLVHCETIEDARARLRCFQGETYILDSTFERIESHQGPCSR